MERLQPGGLDVAPNEKLASFVGNCIGNDGLATLATLATLAIAASATAANPANCAIPANPFD